MCSVHHCDHCYFSVSTISLLPSTVTITSTASGQGHTLAPTEHTLDKHQSSSSVEELQEELGALEDEGQEKNGPPSSCEHGTTAAASCSGHCSTSSDTSSAIFPTSSQLRGLGSLNDQFNRIIYGSSAAAAIADPVMVSQPTQASHPWHLPDFR